MVEVRAIVPGLQDKDGKDIPLNETVDVDVEVAGAWRAAGKVTLITTEQALEEAARTGHYSDVVGREEVGQVSATTSHPGPQADEAEDEPKPRRKR